MDMFDSGGCCLRPLAYIIYTIPLSLLEKYDIDLILIYYFITLIIDIIFLIIFDIFCDLFKT